MTVSFRLWYRKLGGHVHVRVFSSEFGPATTHGLDGTLTFRPQAWEAFRKAMGARQAAAEDLLALARALRHGARASTERRTWWRRALARLSIGVGAPRPDGVLKAEALEAAATALLRETVSPVFEFADENEIEDATR